MNSKAALRPRRFVSALAALVLAAAIAPAGALAATTTVPPTTVAPATTRSVTTTTLPAPAAQTAVGTRATTVKKGTSRLSHGALVAAILGGLIVLACLVWGVFRFGALEPRWLLSLRHALAEAGFRTSATWAEFSDWIRIGH